MANFSVKEKVIRKIKKSFIPLCAKHNQKKLNNLDFTIISNNCWGGVCYEYFNLPKNSPTVGSYFFADDYIKFISKLKNYLSLKLEIINARESKYFSTLKELNQLNVPVGKLDDIEIVLLHYKDPKVALEKWKRRVDRINWDNLIVKFSYMSKCNDSHIESFQRIKGIKNNSKQLP